MTKFYQWLVVRLPKRLIYFSTIQLIAEVTTGEYGNTDVARLGAMDAVKRFSDLYATEGPVHYLRPHVFTGRPDAKFPDLVPGNVYEIQVAKLGRSGVEIVLPDGRRCPYSSVRTFEANWEEDYGQATG